MDTIFVSCAPGLEKLLAEELQKLGVPLLSQQQQGIHIPKSMEWVYRVNYGSRIAARVLWPLLSFPCIDRRDLYMNAGKVRWQDYLRPNMTFAIDANIFRNPNLRNSHFAALVVKDALCDQIREKTGSRPNVSLDNPDVQIHLFLHGQKASLSIDTSLDPLFKRGYRQQGAIAPLQESLAAALLSVSGLNSQDIFCDPCCGSGTILIEAAMILSNTPSGYFRKRWGFYHHPEFNKTEWDRIKQEFDSKRIPLPRDVVFGADRDPVSLALCRRNLEASGFASSIATRECDVAHFNPPKAPTLLVTNPPYGKRLDLSKKTYSALARFFVDKMAPQARAFVLTPREDAFSQSLGKARPAGEFFAGGLDVVLYSLTGA